jgi:hypothetical protein
MLNPSLFLFHPETFCLLSLRRIDASLRRALARLFFSQTERLFVFIRHPGVEPANNISEQTLRTAVQWRKICFGNRSKNGEIATARLLTAAATCEMQQRNILKFLTETVQAYRAGQSTPSLLPKAI